MRNRGMRPFLAGLLAVTVIVILCFFAFSRANPFSEPYELTATFNSANNLKKGSPVRTAGVAIGTVKEVTPLAGDRGSGARVKMEIEKTGLPIHKDAELSIRPRIFLEGNFFVDLDPGSPSAPVLEADDDAGIPVQQTATPVQFEQVLSALQKDTRTQLQTLLQEYSHALTSKNYEGADGFNRSIKYWEDAYKNSAIANEATLGEEEGDLGRVLKGQAKVAAALADEPKRLSSLVTNFNTTAGAFAREEQALARAVPALRDVVVKGQPALAHLNEALPSLRAFAIDALPGVRSSGPTLDAALPFIRQARRLVSRAELRGLVADLRQTIPALASVNASTPSFLDESRELSSCQNTVVIPFATTDVPDVEFPGNTAPFYKLAPRGLVGLSGESRISDANTPLFRAQFNGGPTTIVQTGDFGEKYFAQNLLPISGTRPATDPQPRFRPDVPCETQQAPDLNAPAGRGDQNVTPNPQNTAANRAREARGLEEIEKLGAFLQADAQSLPVIDPLTLTAKDERFLNRTKEFKQLDNGLFLKSTATKRERRLAEKVKARR